MKRCFGCMSEYDEEYDICPYCGYSDGDEADGELGMEPGTVLNNRFVIGRQLGGGTYGITYIGWDNLLEHKVAIKEYLPTELCTRRKGHKEIIVFKEEKREQFISGISRFVDEAKRLAKFTDVEGIVRIYDSFSENNTAYIVMEYLDGETLGEILDREGTIEEQSAVAMMMPIMEALKKVNAEGIIHRSITPDNIMITKDGRVKLIDFSAARYASTSHSKSLSVLVEQGYSPEEQYRSKGDQGPHTDVYSMAAVLYKMITGITPPDALERRAYFQKGKKDILMPISKYVKKIDENIENAILNALNVQIEDRTPNMEALIYELTTTERVKRRYGSIKKIDILRWPLWAKILAPTGIIAVAALSILLATGVIGFKNNIEDELILPDGMTIVPNIVNLLKDDAEPELEAAHLEPVREANDISDNIPEGYVLTQSIVSGTVTGINTTVKYTVSKGPDMVTMPHVETMPKEEAAQAIEELGLTIEYSEEYDMLVAAGNVIKTDPEGGKEIPVGSVVLVMVSKGADPNVEQKIEEVVVPDLVGKEFDYVKIWDEYKIKCDAAKNREYSDTIPENHIISQSIKAGKKIKNDQTIEVVVSKGKHISVVPELEGETKESAIVLLEKNELVLGNIIEEENDRNAAGVILRMCIDGKDIEAGTEVSPNTKIDIVVSKGAGSFQMIDVSGMSESEAKSKLMEMGLSVSVDYMNDKSIESGKVISQSIAAGTDVKAGDIVAITVSTGEKLYEVPDVVNKKRDDAVKELESLKFVVQVNEIYDESVAKGYVVAQSLYAGSKYKEDTDIIISVSKGKQPIKITYDANGGSCKTKSKTVYLGGKYGKLPSASRKNYDFAGWYTSSIGGVKVTENSTISQIADQTIYAHWDRKVATVSYDLGDGKIYTTRSCWQGDKYSIPSAPYKANYEFEGWYTKDGKKITEKDEITSSGKIVLSAKWTPKKYKVTFDVNKGEGSNTTIEETYAGKYSLPEDPKREGYKFIGWYTSSASGDRITKDSTVTISRDSTFYAHWEAYKYKIVYDANGGTGNMSPSEFVYDKEARLSKNEFTKENYKFVGWEDKNGTKYEDQKKVKNIIKPSKDNEEIKLSARWERVVVSVTFDADDGNGGTTKNINQGDNYVLPSNPTKDYYNFKGWYTSRNGGGDKITSDTKVTNGSAHTVYACWERVEVSVTFDVDGGNGGTTKNINQGDNYVLPSNPTRDYYNFKGWYTSRNGGGDKITSSTKVTNGSAHTLYAHWELKDAVTESYNSSKNYGNMVKSYTYKSTLTKVASSTPSAPSGYLIPTKAWNKRVKTGSTTTYYLSDTSNLDTTNSTVKTYNQGKKSTSSPNKTSATTTEVTSGAFCGYLYYRWCIGNDRNDYHMQIKHRGKVAYEGINEKKWTIETGDYYLERCTDGCIFDIFECAFYAGDLPKMVGKEAYISWPDYTWCPYICSHFNDYGIAVFRKKIYSQNTITYTNHFTYTCSKLATSTTKPSAASRSDGWTESVSINKITYIPK